MDDIALPSSILLYIAGATSVVVILVNGIRTAIALPAIVAFLGACVLGFVFICLFEVANGETMTPQLWAASVIAGVMVGGASAGSNAVHSRSLPTEPMLEVSVESSVMPADLISNIADELEARRTERVAARLRDVSPNSGGG